MNKYRTHNCNELSISNNGEEIILSGWINKKRDHGNLLFIDLRDNYGITQCIIDKENKNFLELEKTQLETVIKIQGKVINRSNETINKDIETGEIEVVINKFEILGTCKELPMPVFSDQEYAEEIRLKYRFLDLRRKKIHENIILRSKVISYIRNEMTQLGFLEFQTPILTSSSPEGARDFLVPSRLNPGKFYALPQAPQQFKQLIMVSGFDKYFQIAPCFRDEDARADRSPGEFYQLDLEMSFVEQEDVFNVVETLMVNTFKKFSNKKLMYDKFPKISYADAMLKYGSDKPDLRNPLLINDITEIFSREDVSFEIFKKLVKSGSKVRCISTKNTKNAQNTKQLFTDANVDTDSDKWSIRLVDDDDTPSISGIGYDYCWTPDATNGTWANNGVAEVPLPAGNYDVFATDINGCSATFSTQITEPDVLEMSTDEITNVLCFGDSTGSVQLLAAGGTGNFDFSINGNSNSTGFFQNLPAGNYDAIVTDENNCNNVITFEIIEAPELLFSITNLTTDTGNGNGSVTFKGTGGTPPYLFSVNGLDYQQGTTFPILVAGNYTGYIQDANGCIIESLFEIILQTTISNLDLGVLEMNVFPNPFSEKIILHMDLVFAQTINLKMINISGQTLLQSKTNVESGKQNIALDVENNIPTGIYFLSVKNKNQAIGYFKIIKH